MMVRKSAALALALGALTPACSSCDGSSAGGPAASASAPASPASASAMPRASLAPSVPSPPRKAELPCRALSVSGEVRTESGAPVAHRSLLDGKNWLRLAKGAKLTTRDTTSARELAAVGPALVLPCVGGDEDWLLAEGTVVTTAGAGARPGAEVAVYTPLGSVSYGDARIEIHAAAHKVELSQITGEAWIRAAAGARLTGREKLVPKARATLSGSPNAASLVEACEKAADESERLVRAVLAPPAGVDGGSLGDRAAAHLRARRAARAACGSARAAAALEKDEGARRDLEARVGRAEQRWKAIPSPARPPVPPKSSGG
jgi:hypothetical protein